MKKRLVSILLVIGSIIAILACLFCFGVFRLMRLHVLEEEKEIAEIVQLRGEELGRFQELDQYGYVRFPLGTGFDPKDQKIYLVKGVYELEATMGPEGKCFGASLYLIPEGEKSSGKKLYIFSNFNKHTETESKTYQLKVNEGTKYYLQNHETCVGWLKATLIKRFPLDFIAPSSYY